MDSYSKNTTFGFKKVSFEEKTSKVKDVFDSVASNYDLMNDLMSLGLHRLWKREAILACSLTKGATVLDLAGGTGDLSREFYNITGDTGCVILGDINYSMLTTGRDKSIDNGLLSGIRYMQCNAEHIPLASNSVDCVSIAFGLRNVAKQQQSLDEIYRVIKPGGRLVVLEFSKVKQPAVSKAYDFYSFKFIPCLGKLVAKDADSYKYLVESIKMHPDQKTLLGMLQMSGFEDCSYRNLAAGVCAIHIGYKY